MSPLDARRPSSSPDIAGLIVRATEGAGRPEPLKSPRSGLAVQASPIETYREQSEPHDPEHL